MQVDKQFENKLNEYADLIACVGGNIVKGDYVIIYCETTAGGFAEMVAEKCYQRGAKWVEIQWKDACMDLLNARYANEEKLYKTEEWELKRMQKETDWLPVTIRLLSTENGCYSAESLARRQEAMRVRSLAEKPYKDALNNRHKWTAAGVSTPGWASLVYPGDPEGVAKLWEDIFTICMVNGDGTASRKWQKKIQGIEAHREIINGMGIRKLHFKTGLGTDLTAELPQGSRFAGGANRVLGYAPNLPTEEIFTSPDKNTVEGTLVSSTPLYLNNQMIEGIRLGIKKGKVVSVEASRGEEFFRNYIHTDEGASMFGELAIVDKNSPIGAIGHLMLSTLFDENAACHAAVGRGFATTLSNYTELSPEQVKEKGINDSSIHCDIMFGTSDTDVTGITEDGKVIELLKNGSWQI